MGGVRGSLEVALPIAVFGLTYVVVDEIVMAAAVAAATVGMAGVARLAAGSTLRFVRNGAIGLAVAVLFASVTGRAEDAFLPGLVQSALWVVVLGGSVALGRPVGGYVIGAVLDDPTGWREEPAIVRLATQLTLVLLVPMVIRVAVQLPLYLAGAVGWLGVSRLVLGWPLHAATLAGAGLLLLRGATPLPRRSATDHEDGTAS